MNVSWTEELLSLYDKNVSEAGIIHYKSYVKNGKEESVPYVLLPPFHTTVKAQIQIILSSEGIFLGASKVDNEDQLTIIPVTEKSGSRTAGKAAHPLCDNLKYLAGDYGEYVPDKKGNPAEYHEMYMEGLKKWHLSRYTHPKVDAIYAYMKKGILIKDLLRERVLELDENGHLSEEIKIQNISQTMAFVRFIVRNDEGMEEGFSDKCWEDRSLQECFIRYYQSIESEKSIDYITGEMQTPSYLHSKKIRDEGDGAKLISSNDEANFTFKGRFATKEQAFSIGNMSSQKLHNALKWIIRKQGKRYDTLMLVTWESDMKNVIPWDEDTETIWEAATAGTANKMGEEDVFMDSFEDDWDEGGGTEDTDENPITARQFYNALEGYGKSVEHTSHMVLMAFDAATTGRLALEEYRSLETTRYLKNIEKWHDQCGWLQSKHKNGKKFSYYGVPGVSDIADLLYGSESKGRLMIGDKNRKRLYAETSRRLIPCIWDGRNLPYDLVMTAINKASAPLAYEKRYNWESVLALACSFVKKNRIDRNPKEEWDMALNESCKDRSYLYGRLLAVADRIEFRTYDREKDAGRITNAKRYMSTFSMRPFETWKIIEENLQPYLNKLSITERRFYENLLDGIFQLFDIEDFQKNDRLDGLYLLGFHSQSYELRQYKKENE